MRTRKLLFTISASLFVAQFAISQQHVWRVNKSASLSQWTGHRVFNELQQAINSNDVSPGDTLYVEASPTYYEGATLNKKLTIIGTGYFLDENDQPQHNHATSLVYYINFAENSSESTISGISFTGGAGSGAHIKNYPLHDITITRCNGYVSFENNLSTPISNIHLTENYMALNAGYANASGLIVTNNYFDSDFSIAALAQGSASNNVVQGNLDINGLPFYNNIVLGNSLSVSNNSTNIYNNIFAFAQPTGFMGINNNFGFTESQIFLDYNNGSTDGKYKLKLPAQCPECYRGYPWPSQTGTEMGIFGGSNSGNEAYRLNGIPNIPTIKTLQAPSSVFAGQSTSITVSTKSNN